MIIIAGTIDFRDNAARDSAVTNSQQFQDATRAGEAGCEAYCFAADPCVPTRVQVYELWADEASLAAHFEHPNYLDMRAMLGDAGMAAADAQKYRCDLREPVYDSTFTPRADFFTG